MSAIQRVPFHGLSLSAVLVNGAPCVAIRPICDSLGLNWSGQFRRIQRDAELKASVVVMATVAEDGKRRKMLFLPLDRLNGWLFGVDVARVREELRERMNWYRRECYAVLARHFGLSRPGADLHARLIEAEREEAQSFAVAQACSKGMNRRRVEKSRLSKRIDELRELVQLALPLEGGAA
ncbi:phage antirepressor N-terminal domain-containing protein [Sphaerotilus sp.]|uniref:phage antirepressor N-terminal domain-containing protein n=1 Tax=Sphaerotilus sp. TaxID=2093942 RepID=UPI0034E1F8D7